MLVMKSKVMSRCIRPQIRNPKHEARNKSEWPKNKWQKNKEFL